MLVFMIVKNQVKQKKRFRDYEEYLAEFLFAIVKNEMKFVHMIVKKKINPLIML